MSKNSLSFKIDLCLIVMFLVSMLSSVTAFVTFERAKINTGKMADVYMPLAEQVVAIQNAIMKMRINGKEYLIHGTQNVYDNVLENYNAAYQISGKMSSIIDSQNDTSLNELKKEVSSIETLLKSYIELMKKNRDVLNELDKVLEIADQIGTEFTNNIMDFEKTINGWLTDMVLNSGNKNQDQSMLKIWFKLLGYVQTILLENEKADANVALMITSRESTYIKQVETHSDNILAALNNMQNITVREQMKANIRNMQKLIPECAKSTDSIAKLLVQLNKQEKEGGNLGIEIEKSLEKISENTIIESINKAGYIFGMISKSNILTIICLVLLIIAAVAIAIYININVLGKLKNFVKVVGEFTSGEGDLTRRIPETSKDELGMLAQNFNRFVENVHRIIINVKESAGEVASGNNQLAATMEELASTFNSQSEQVSSVAQNMNTLSDSSKLMVANLAGNITKMRDANESVKEGSNQLHKVLGNMDDIKNKTEKLNNTIYNLAESSGKIGDILGVINDIADQTNLLALNAAIEAARAGDAGRGFAVVADEVRKLAERTQRSTSEISAIITSLQKESSMASGEMKDAETSVNSGLDSIRKTDASFVEVVSSVQDIDNTTHDVNSNMNDQFTMIHTVSDNTNAIAAGIEESMHAVSEVAATVNHLQKMAESLKLLVSKFKV
ncbi:MAG: methyl-accepting chemotaxis protein [Deferribacteraceae bacterium]|jgi:methyl-accepting chemotaxis protein|nr:methyl-accepting chemotaxis protein [Deferribacteraceae bacterium]